MSILTFPDILPRAAEWSLRSNTQSFRSPLSGTVQTLELPGAIWQATLSFARLPQDRARELAAFLVRLRGEAGRFYLYDHSLPAPRGSASGVPVVAGAGQTGATLATSGWTPGVAGILKAGDYIGLGDELKMVVADADSDVGGLATLTIEPPLRQSPADASLIITVQPVCIMKLTGDQAAKWSTVSPLRSSFTIECEEALV